MLKIVYKIIVEDKKILFSCKTTMSFSMSDSYIELLINSTWNWPKSEFCCSIIKLYLVSNVFRELSYHIIRLSSSSILGYKHPKTKEISLYVPSS